MRNVMQRIRNIKEVRLTLDLRDLAIFACAAGIVLIFVVLMLWGLIHGA